MPVLWSTNGFNPNFNSDFNFNPNPFSMEAIIVDNNIEQKNEEF